MSASAWAKDVLRGRDPVKFKAYASLCASRTLHQIMHVAQLQPAECFPPVGEGELPVWRLPLHCKELIRRTARGNTASPSEQARCAADGGAQDRANRRRKRTAKFAAILTARQDDVINLQSVEGVPWPNRKTVAQTVAASLGLSATTT